jgi:hypothetical protein
MAANEGTIGDVVAYCCSVSLFRSTSVARKYFVPEEVYRHSEVKTFINEDTER